MRRCFYHADLVQNAVHFTIFQDKLHSFNIPDHRSARGLLISETVQKNFQNHLYSQPVLTFDKRQICDEINVIKNLLSLFFVNVL